MMIVLPDWTIELEEKLDKVIKDLAIKYHIDFFAINDSKSIEEGKHLISHALIRLYENYKVEERIKLEEFVKGMRKKRRRK